MYVCVCLCESKCAMDGVRVCVFVSLVGMEGRVFLF